MYDRAVFAERVKTAAAEKGIKLSRLSAHAFQCETALHGILNHGGEYGPTAETLWKLADELGVSIDYLVGRTDE